MSGGESGETAVTLNQDRPRDALRPCSLLISLVFFA